MNRNYSSWTGSDLEAIEKQIVEARAVFLQRKKEYDYSISQGNHSYAKRNRLPPMQAAEASLKSLETSYEQMLSVMGRTQAIDIVDTTVNEALDKPETEVPWKTIGLAVGALVVIVVIIKVI